MCARTFISFAKCLLPALKAKAFCEKLSPACQDSKPQHRIADSSSTNAVNFSSARTTKRFPSLRCASATKIVRPSESKAETQPQPQPALLRLSAMISQYRDGLCLFCSPRGNHRMMLPLYFAFL